MEAIERENAVFNIAVWCRDLYDDLSYNILSLPLNCVERAVILPH